MEEGRALDGLGAKIHCGKHGAARKKNQERNVRIRHYMLTSKIFLLIINGLRSDLTIKLPIFGQIRLCFKKLGLRQMTSRIPESVYDRIHDRVGVTPFFSRNSLFRDQDIALGITGLIINLNAVDSSVTELVREVLWKP